MLAKSTKASFLELVKPGRIYLIEGSLQELRWALKDIVIKFIIYPTTQDYLLEFSYLSGVSKHVVFIPRTGELLPKSESNEALPTDIKVTANNYYYIVYDPLQQNVKEQKAFYKRLAGGLFTCVDMKLACPIVQDKDLQRINDLNLDLSNYQSRPLSLYRHLQELAIPPDGAKEQSIVSLFQCCFGPRPFSEFREKAKSSLYSIFKYSKARYPHDLACFIKPIIDIIQTEESSEVCLNYLALFSYFLRLAFTLDVKQGEKGYYLNLYAKRYSHSKVKHLKLWIILLS